MFKGYLTDDGKVVQDTTTPLDQGLAAKGVRVSTRTGAWVIGSVFKEHKLWIIELHRHFVQGDHDPQVLEFSRREAVKIALYRTGGKVSHV